MALGEAHTSFFLKVTVGLLFFMTIGELSQRCCHWAATGILIWSTLTSSFIGFSSGDVIAVLAAILFVRSLPLLAKRVLMLAATYPLALILPIARETYFAKVLRSGGELSQRRWQRSGVVPSENSARAGRRSTRSATTSPRS